jgi:hypothetical protein
MAFKNFSDFIPLTQRELLPSDFLVGYREFNQEFRTRIDDLTLELLKKLDLEVAPEVLYVNPNGKDTNSGRSDFSAFRTIKRAAAKALELSVERRNRNLDNILPWGINFRQVNIFVRAGDYIEDNPVYLPPSTTVIGDNLRATTIIPKNRFYDVFWVNNRCYVWGFTFRRHLKPSYAIAYPEMRQVGGIDREAYPSTRLASATARALEYFSTYPDLPLLYNVTRVNKPEDDLANLSDDDQGSEPEFDPWNIAFLDRYFKNFPGEPFYNEAELIDGAQFIETEWFRNNVRRPYQLTSPYTQGGSSITQATSAGANDAGGGVLVDGYQVDGPLRSMVMDSFTQFNEGGKGIHIINNGYAQLVSTFTICCTEGVICESGGTCSINTSNCSFGLSGLVAIDKSPRPTLIGTLAQDLSSASNTITVNKLSGFWYEQEFPLDYQPYPGQVFQIVFGTNNELSATNDGVFFTALSCTKAIQEDNVDPLNTDVTFYSTLVLETNYNPRSDTSLNADINNPTITIIPRGSKVYFYIRSTITTSAHTMEYIGTGTTLLAAVPQKGGQTDTSTEVAQDIIGRVFFTSTNQFGDFRIGQGLTIVQSTGTIEGETFERSILNIVTPFTIAIASSL